MSSITLKNIHKAYGKDVIIPDLNFTIEDGSFTVLVGNLPAAENQPPYG